MRFRVIAKEPREFDQWIGEQQQGPAVPFQVGTGAQTQPAGPTQELMSTKFQCTNCHSIGDSKVSSYGPNLTHFASRTTFASGYYGLNKDRLVEWVHNAPGLIPMESKALPGPGRAGGRQVRRHAVVQPRYSGWAADDDATGGRSDRRLPPPAEVNERAGEPR